MKLFAWTLLAVLVSAGAARASGSQVWVTDTLEDFAAGEAEGLVVSSRGTLFLGQASVRVEAGDESIWSAVPTAEGLLVGTAPGGKLLRVAGAKLAPVFDTTEFMVSALVAAADGSVYAATIPNGRIFRRDAQGVVSDFATLDDGHVWCLALAADGKTLYAGTGPAGRLYAITVADGEAKALWKGKDTNVLDLALAADGTLYFSTASDGRVYRVAPDGAVRLLTTLPEGEVRALALAGGILYAGANTAKQGVPRTYTLRTAPDGATPPPPEAGRPQEAPEGFHTALYRIEASGAPRELWAADETFITDLAPTPGRGVYVATGIGGKVYEVADEGRHQLVFDAPDEKVLALVADAEGLKALGAGEKGAVITLAGEADEGVYTSAVHDAKGPARWGRLTVDASFLPIPRETPALTIEARTGNVEKPDEAWSDWVAVAAVPSADHDGAQEKPTGVAPGRFFQYRLKLAPKRQVLVRRVSVYYRPENRAPLLAELTLEGFTWLSRRLGGEEHKSEKKITWKVEDPDEDTVVTRLWYRLTGHEQWTLLTRPDPLDKAEFVWNTETMPDGTYELRFEFSDERSNSAARTRRLERVTEAFLIDNRAPRFWNLAVDGQGRVTGEAVDTQSPISQLEYSLDGEQWVLVDPEDEIFDQQRERFAFAVTAAAGRHVLAMRVRDADGNATVEKLEFEVK